MPQSKLSLTQEAVGGLSAGVVGTVIGFPLDTIKARQQVLGRGNNETILSTGIHIVKREGVLGLYRGIVPPLLSLSILNTLNFTSYSYFQSLYKSQRGWDYRNALAGASCGPLASSVSTVENLIKTQLQLDNVTAKRYKGSVDVLQQLVKEDGLKVLYTGHAVNTARETFFLFTYFGVYEGLREALFHLNHDGKNHPLLIPVAGGCAGAIAWAASFPLDCVRAGVQGQNLQTKKRKGAWQVFAELMKTRGIRGLYSGVQPSIVRAFLVSGSRFTAYETALWLLRGGRDVGLVTLGGEN